MIVESLTLKNFRNHSYSTFDFKEKVNVISGPNASGKTSIVEAIYYLSLARSFRLNDDDGLIHRKKSQAEILATTKTGNIKRKFRVVLTKDSKQVYINEKPVKKLSDLAKCVNVILFEPKDVLFFRGNPKVRRNFIDISIAKKSAPYFDYISRYDKVLKTRNELLKQDKIDPVLLETTTEMLIKLSGPIVSYRQVYVKGINEIINKITRALACEEMEVEVIYKPFVPYTKEFQKDALELFKKNQDNDIRKKITNIGIHREDIVVNLNGLDISEYGSQGENRLVALALKLAPYFLIEDKDDRPIIVLDDVMSELDDAHQRKLIAFIQKFEQVFITGTNLEIKGSNQYQIKKKNKEVF